ncbi:MAG: aldehyde ferredoxin oxidoreductase family protein [Candidatus Bathyarchaeota archaeon]|nr:aldehyde ferredoxin oxidoreductase family protein [Candidatus Bathyarchaeota archaeon]
MLGWNGRFLKVNLTGKKFITETYDATFASTFLGGRGFAAKILWDTLPAGTAPFSPENKLVFATGPLTGFPLPSSGKLVVSSKSPLTGGYGDGNLGTFAAVHLRKAGYDAVIIEGKAEKPTILHVKDRMVEFVDAKEYWGTSSFETEAQLRRIYGRNAGIVSIGQGGENLVKFACVVAQEGRAGGRPGMGAVMGSKNLKAAVFEGTGTLVAADPQKLKKWGSEGYKEILGKRNYAFWRRQGTLSTTEWANQNGVLPTFNYREGTFTQAEKISGFTAEEVKVANRGCPNCNMNCGNVIKDAEGRNSELDYENVAMLGSNIGLGDLKQVAVLNRMADEFGLDTISLGSTLGFAMEASEKRLIKQKIEWGNFSDAKKLTEDIAFRRGLGDVLAEGVRVAAAKIGGGSTDWAMHVKGLEVSAYNCRAAPAMALAYGTSPIGAHHKDAFVVGWEVMHHVEGYGEEKVDKVIEYQHTRGIFECLGVCRFPFVNIGLEKEWYPKYLYAITGQKFFWEDLCVIAERVFNLVRAFWIRENQGRWTREMDFPPTRWFSEPLTGGLIKGAKLDRTKYDEMLQVYYKKRGWDEEGIPKKVTLEKLGLAEVAVQVAKYVELH